MSEIKTTSAFADQIANFFKQFKDPKGDYKYVNQFDSLKQNSSILINTKDFLESKLDDALEIYNELNINPTEFLTSAFKAVKIIYSEKNKVLEFDFTIHIDEVERTPSIVEVLGNEYLNQIVTIKGMIITSTDIFLIPKEIIYKCSNGHKFTLSNKGDGVPSPYRCGYEQKCTSKQFESRLEESTFSKHRLLLIKSDESFSFTDDELELDITGDLTEVAQAGDKVKVTGIVKPIMRNKLYKSNLKTLFIQKTDGVDLTISPEDEEVFKEFPNQSDFYTRMINSIAPSVLDLTEVKESMLLQRIGSPDILRDDGTKVRGNFHIGLFGDPGTAKSKLGEWEEANLVKTVFIMSKGATSTGLLLGLEEGSDGRKRLRAGAMVLCRDDGLVVLDEFPRLSTEVIDGLYTTMENQIASISKTGHVKSLSANTPVLATGNAHTGKWDTALNLSDNLGLPSTFLQRFDYMWIFIDEFDEKKDNKLADITLNGTTYEDEQRPHSSVTLSKYIKFVRRFKPQLSEDVSKYLKEAYLELRKDPKAKDNGISLRHLNTMMRTTLAIARLYQKPYATEEDADKAVELIRKMFKQRSISISEADTYVQRNFNKAIEILKIESMDGLLTEELFKKVIEYGTPETQQQTRIELGQNSSWRENKRWREVIDKLKKSPLIIRVSQKPLILSYDHNKGDITSFTK